MSLLARIYIQTRPFAPQHPQPSRSLEEAGLAYWCELLTRPLTSHQSHITRKTTSFLLFFLITLGNRNAMELLQQDSTEFLIKPCVFVLNRNAQLCGNSRQFRRPYTWPNFLNCAIWSLFSSYFSSRSFFSVCCIRSLSPYNIHYSYSTTLSFILVMPSNRLANTRDQYCKVFFLLRQRLNQRLSDHLCYYHYSYCNHVSL